MEIFRNLVRGRIVDVSSARNIILVESSAHSILSEMHFGQAEEITLWISTGFAVSVRQNGTQIHFKASDDFATFMKETILTAQKYEPNI